MRSARWVALALAIATALLLVAGGSRRRAARRDRRARRREIVWNIRAPRVVMALLVGSPAWRSPERSCRAPWATRSPTPALVGVSAGAALGAVAAVAVRRLVQHRADRRRRLHRGRGRDRCRRAVSMHDRRPEVVTLLLAGVAVTAFAGAVARCGVVAEHLGRDAVDHVLVQREPGPVDMERSRVGGPLRRRRSGPRGDHRHAPSTSCRWATAARSRRAWTCAASATARSRGDPARRRRRGRGRHDRVRRPARPARHAHGRGPSTRAPARAERSRRAHC